MFGRSFQFGVALVLPLSRMLRTSLWKCLRLFLAMSDRVCCACWSWFSSNVLMCSSRVLLRCGKGVGFVGGCVVVA